MIPTEDRGRAGETRERRSVSDHCRSNEVQAGAGGASRKTIGARLLGNAWRRLKSSPRWAAPATYIWAAGGSRLRASPSFYFCLCGYYRRGPGVDRSRRRGSPGTYFVDLRSFIPGTIEAVLRAPSLFWLNASTVMIATLAWAGLAAAGRLAP